MGNRAPRVGRLILGTRRKTGGSLAGGGSGTVPAAAASLRRSASQSSLSSERPRDRSLQKIRAAAKLHSGCRSRPYCR